MPSQVQHIIKAGDSIVRANDLEWADPNDFSSDQIVILVHGFTSHGMYLQQVGRYLQGFGYQAFIFNYNSYRGVRKASQSLKDFLMRYDRQLGGQLREKVSLSWRTALADLSLETWLWIKKLAQLSAA